MPSSTSPAWLEEFHGRPLEEVLGDPRLPEAHEALLAALEAGELRAARRRPDGTWEAVAWVKRAILVGFRSSGIVPFPEWPGGARDKAAYPPCPGAPRCGAARGSRRAWW
jgi:hypothetical protein